MPGAGAVLPALLMLGFAQAAGAAVASGRHWQIAIEGIECAQATLAIGMRIRYLGPAGPVEAPVSRLAGDRRYPPKSLVWRDGRRELAQWLAAGGVTYLQAHAEVDVQIRFDVRGATGALRLEFGDIGGFAVTGKGGCAGVLEPRRLSAPKRAAPAASRPATFRVYRAIYPCLTREGKVDTVEAEYPPYLPRQLLVLGRGYLPAAREIELPMGRAPAQAYAYAGADELDAVDDAVRRAVAADFPRHRRGKTFAFNWGMQKTRSGNDAYSVGLYELRRCRD
jgi:hypothetical protein